MDLKNDRSRLYLVPSSRVRLARLRSFRLFCEQTREKRRKHHSLKLGDKPREVRPANAECVVVFVPVRVQMKTIAKTCSQRGSRVCPRGCVNMCGLCVGALVCVSVEIYTDTPTIH